jgi:hypothetical protein
MREHRLEWLHRLASEPRLLWKRYLVTNSLFVWGVARQSFLQTAVLEGADALIIVTEWPEWRKSWAARTSTPSKPS